MDPDEMTLDEVALAAILAGEDTDLSEVAEHLRLAATGELECPECGHAGPHDDNGAVMPEDISYLCAGCGIVFDAE